MTGNKSSEKKELVKKENFSEWYDNILLEAKIADDRYPVKGFTVYTGWGFATAKRIIAMLGNYKQTVLIFNDIPKPMSQNVVLKISLWTWHYTHNPKSGNRSENNCEVLPLPSAQK